MEILGSFSCCDSQDRAQMEASLRTHKDSKPTAGNSQQQPRHLAPDLKSLDPVDAKCSGRGPFFSTNSTGIYKTVGAG